MQEITIDLEFEALLGTPTNKNIYPLCLSCGGSTYVSGESVARNIKARKGLCLSCSRKYKEFLKSEKLTAADNIKRDKAFYSSLALAARKANRYRARILRSSQSREQYLLWRCRRWLGRVFKEIMISKQRKEYLLENSDHIGLRECSKCSGLKFLMDFPKNAEGLYTSKVCSSCQEERRKVERARERAKDRQARLARQAQSTKFTLPPTEVERKLAARRAKKALKKRLRADPVHRIHRNFSEIVRAHVRKFKQSKPSGGWQAIVGYSIYDLKEHIEKQFEEGMCWGNYGEWHIDHIIPKSAFRVEYYGDQQFLACWDLSNLQPLWAEDNIRKSNSLVWNTCSV